MEYEVQVSEAAENDIDEILTYMLEEQSNPEAAKDFANALGERLIKMQTQPLTYELSRSESLAQMGYRRFVIGNNVVLYLVNENKRVVIIFRVLYGPREYKKYI